MYFSIHIVFAIQSSSKTSSTNENSALYSNHISQNNHNSVTANHVNANAATVTSSLSHHSSTNENRKNYSAMSSTSSRPMLQVIISLFCAWVFGFLGGFGPMLEWKSIRKSSNCLNWHSQHRIIPLFHTYYLFLGSIVLPALIIAVNLTRFYCCLLSTPRDYQTAFSPKNFIGIDFGLKSGAFNHFL